MRRFYLHTRNGIYYAELVDPETGHKLTTGFTVETGKERSYLLIIVYHADR